MSKISIELHKNHDATNQTVASNTVSTEHRINVLDLTVPEESPVWAKVFLLAIKLNNT